MTVFTRRPGRLVALPLAASLVAAALLAVPSGAGAAGPCTMHVSTTRTSTQSYPSGVDYSTYNVKVVYGNRSQSATVQRMVMPAGATPRLVHRRLGWTATIHDQIVAQAPKGIAAVNGDFFYEYQTGRGRVVLPRGPSVGGGAIVRPDDEDMRVVGLDTKGRPFTGMMRVAGTVQRARDTFTVSGLNWHWLGSQGGGRLHPQLGRRNRGSATSGGGRMGRRPWPDQADPDRVDARQGRCLRYQSGRIRK